ncbi:FKBP-type peptidyl-prolyl cis-trans isomerase [Perilla frutescens var. hirtella]|uniref:FKBP-type peptidyl-prolyl cis-trans isomerase n=1 Tax=Perilla frutescens var. hirtella TaxID=608512 RepID=A0AAD4P592_PERFH|nr:FKBP-type peptidyl-prolyl cis-trans isomerase [Perilla frutescens var. hirtella]KAH6826766.1 FKBP-type peptidyl-prolyl cis-trans isomerase [Perilla frutescens var. hirtella]
MATLPPSTLQLPKPNPTFPSSPRPQLPLKLHAPPRAAPEDDSPSEPDQDDSFENRLSQVRLRYRSGTGKKAEARKTKKGKKTGPGSGSGSSVFLPPVPLKEPVSEGVNVEFGFSPYSERVNGRIAILGLTALFVVELATGQGVINYHTPAIVFIQVYFVATVAALYVKYEKEKISVWPQSDK